MTNIPGFLYLPVRKRLVTREVMVGNLPLGGVQPVRLQSMTSVNTLDTAAVVAQSIRMIEAGSELVRITAPGVKEAEHLAVIKKQLHERGYGVPLVADIHFNPEAALVAARIVEKVRINPGNYTDRRTGKTEYTDAEYNAAIERMAQRMAPLIAVCKQYGTAMRIGSNHGSLSERVVSRYGDTPAGMVESAMELIAVCEDAGFFNLVLSMKASNTRVMVQATRLLVARMMERGNVYPIHLGVTEAGEGEDGRIRSAAGIGALLADGIGDTIRVSLTEEPENELPVAREIVRVYYQTEKENESPEPVESAEPLSPVADPFTFSRYISGEWEGLGGGRPVRVVGGRGADIRFSAEPTAKLVSPSGESLLLTTQPDTQAGVPFALMSDAHETGILPENIRPVVRVLNCNHPSDVPTVRLAVAKLRRSPGGVPVIIRYESAIKEAETFAIQASALMGPLLVDGLADGIWLVNPALDEETVTATAFNLLQATRLRFSRTEYISCPSCGRTLFNIQETVRRVREKTSHLTGLTIGVMGCIVNGPGEMAGADYGVVGAGAGKVTLFKADQVKRQGVAESEAAGALVQLIKENGDWHEPPAND